MKRLALIGLGIIAAVGISIATASPQHASNPSIALTPGTDQPITCQYTLTGTLSDPLCPAPTSTPIPTATSTPITAVFSFPNLSSPQGNDAIVTCSNGTLSDQGQGSRTVVTTNYTGWLLHCQPFTPTPAPTATP